MSAQDKSRGSEASAEGNQVFMSRTVLKFPKLVASSHYLAILLSNKLLQSSIAFIMQIYVKRFIPAKYITIWFSPFWLGQFQFPSTVKTPKHHTVQLYSSRWSRARARRSSRQAWSCRPTWPPGGWGTQSCWSLTCQQQGVSANIFYIQKYILYAHLSTTRCFCKYTYLKCCLRHLSRGAYPATERSLSGFLAIAKLSRLGSLCTYLIWKSLRIYSFPVLALPKLWYQVQRLDKLPSKMFACVTEHGHAKIVVKAEKGIACHPPRWLGRRCSSPCWVHP